MKKLLIAIGSLLLAGILVFAAFLFHFEYVNEYKLTDTGTEVSPDGKYAVLFQMVGQPDWPFGATSVRVTV